jgi:hypothetical protein
MAQLGFFLRSEPTVQLITCGSAEPARALRRTAGCRGPRTKLQTRTAALADGQIAHESDGEERQDRDNDVRSGHLFLQGRLQLVDAELTER